MGRIWRGRWALVRIGQKGSEGEKTDLEYIEEDDGASAFHDALVLAHAFEEGRKLWTVPLDHTGCLRERD